MGLFNWRKKKVGSRQEEEKSGSGRFLAFALLNEPEFDFEKLVWQLKEDWAIIVDEKTESGNLVSEIDDMFVVVSLLDVPVPAAEVVANAKTNYRWEDAVAVAEKHQGHLIVSVMPKEEAALEAGKLFVKLLSSISKQDNVIGLNTLGSVLNPAEYIGFAEAAIKADAYPVMNLVFMGIYSSDGGKTVSAYTYGLDVFGKEEMEILNSENSAEEVFSFLETITRYVVEYDVTLKDGETIGFTEEQKLQITYSKAVAVPGKTLKIAY